MLRLSCLDAQVCCNLAAGMYWQALKTQATGAASMHSKCQPGQWEAPGYGVSALGHCKWCNSPSVGPSGVEIVPAAA